MRNARSLSFPFHGSCDVVERFGQVACELCLRLLVVFDPLASIGLGAPNIFQVFLYSTREVARLERLHGLRVAYGDGLVGSQVAELAVSCRYWWS